MTNPSQRILRIIADAMSRIQNLVEPGNDTSRQHFLIALNELGLAYEGGSPRTLSTRREFAEVLRKIADAADEVALDPGEAEDPGM